jgi:hypothetical protein
LARCNGSIDRGAETDYPAGYELGPVVPPDRI